MTSPCESLTQITHGQTHEVGPPTMLAPKFSYHINPECPVPKFIPHPLNLLLGLKKRQGSWWGIYRSTQDTE